MEECMCDGNNYCVSCWIEVESGLRDVPLHAECPDCEGTGWVVVTSATEQMPAHRLETDVD